MERGSIDITTLPGGLDLRETLESGQSYVWRRTDGAPYGQGGPGCWYETTVEDTAIRVRQRDDRLEWEATQDAESIIRRVLRLNDDLLEIYDDIPTDSIIREAIERFRGMRIVRDPPFPCLISFICSTQMRVRRIHDMQRALIDEFGEPISFGETTIRSFPLPDTLANVTEHQLRDLGLGYRAPYVRDTARLVADGVNPADASSLSYEDAREYLTQYPGVGDKVADCVLLFSLGYLEAVPLDTWIQRAIEEEFPDCDRGSYEETSRAIRARLGGEIAGYTQTYLFHHLRTRPTTVDT